MFKRRRSGDGNPGFQDVNNSAKFEPPEKFPKVEKLEQVCGKVEDGVRDPEMIIRQRVQIGRMRNLPERLRFPVVIREVKRYSDKKENKLGCTNLSRGILAPIAQPTFPAELWEVLVPEKDKHGNIIGETKNIFKDQFRDDKISLVKFNKLMDQEAKASGRKQDREEKPRRDSMDEEEVPPQEDDEDGDYAQDHYASADEAEDDAEEDNEASY